MNELGNLSQCMVDSDSGARGRARSLRRKALLASSILEFGLVAAILIWPLVSPGVLSRRTIVTPLPPYRALPPAEVPPTHAKVTSVPVNDYPPIWSTPAPVQRNQQSASETNDPEPPGIYDPSESEDYGSSFAIPGGNGKGPVVLTPPRPPVGAAGPMHVSSGVMQAALIYRVEPVYPVIAKQIHLGGAVHLRAIIKTDGSVGELTLLDGNAILGIAAEAAVRQWRYKPTLLSGQPVEVETIITVNFVLE